MGPGFPPVSRSSRRREVASDRSKYRNEGVPIPPAANLSQRQARAATGRFPPLVGTCRAGRLHRTELVCPQHSSSSSRRLVATEWPQIAQTRAELVEGRSERGMLRPRVRAGEAELAGFEPNVSSGPSAA